MKKILTLLLLCTFCLSDAQQIKFSSDDLPGMEKRMINTDDYYLPLGDNEFLFVGGKSNSHDATVMKLNDNVTLTKLDKNCRTLWSGPEMEGYLSATKFGKNILVFSSKNSFKYGARFINPVHATLIDNETGKIIAEKDIPSYSDKKNIDVYALTDSNKNFRYLILRSTEKDRAIFIPDQDFDYTDNLRAITFDNDLNISSTDLDISDIQKAQFITCAYNNNGDIFLASIKNNVISVNQYNAGSPKISATVDAKTSFENDVVALQGEIKVQKNNIFLTCKFDESKTIRSSFVTAIFNFDDKESYIQQDLMDKDYLKKYAEKTSLINIIGTEFYKDEFIVIKEFHTPVQDFTKLGYNRLSYISYGPVIVSIYSSSMKLLKELEIDEKLTIMYNMDYVGCKLLNNQLFVFYNKTKLSGNKTNYQVINLDNLSLSNEREIKIDSRLDKILYAPSIVWFNNSALFPYMRQSIFNPNGIFTSFTSIDF